MSDFVIENGILRKYTGPGGEVIIPEGVTEIGAWAFYKCETLTSVTVPESVMLISEWAFLDCENLQHVTLPENLTSVGQGTFAGCRKLANDEGFVIMRGILFGYFGSKGTVVIPEGVTTIAVGAFNTNTPITELYLPGSVTAIFEIFSVGYTNSVCVAIPDSVERIVAPHMDFAILNKAKLQRAAALGYLCNSELFVDSQIVEDYQKYVTAQKSKLVPLLLAWDAVAGIACYAKAGKISAENLDNVFLEPAMNVNATQCIAFLLDWRNQHIATADIERLFLRGITKVPDNVADAKKIWSYRKLPDGTLEITSYKGDALEVEIPARIGRSVVTTIGQSAFSQYGIRTKQSRDVLRQLKKVMIPEGVTVIGNRAFEGCEELTTVSIPRSVVCIGEEAFCACYGLQAIVIPGHAVEIAHKAFALTGLQRITIKDPITRIGKDAFYYGCCPTIHAPAGSYAEIYAKRNSIPFVAE